jgi:hypothetical protein
MQSYLTLLVRATTRLDKRLGWIVGPEIAWPSTSSLDRICPFLLQDVFKA